MAVATVGNYLPTAVELNSALADLTVNQRPWRIHCVSEIPSTSWYRLVAKPAWLKTAPVSTADKPVFALQSNGSYKKLPEPKRKAAAK